MFHSLAFAKGAVFDYEEIVAKRELDRGKMRRAITPHLKGKRAKSLRLPYADPDSGKELLLFIDRGYDFGRMRTWILKGICEACDYDEEIEEDGSIREWLNVEIE